MSDILQRLDDQLRMGSNTHCLFVGNSVAKGSPSKFCHVKGSDGNVTFHGEGATVEQALRDMLDKIKPQRRKMPGM